MSCWAITGWQPCFCSIVTLQSKAVEQAPLQPNPTATAQTQGVMDPAELRTDPSELETAAERARCVPDQVLPPPPPPPPLAAAATARLLSAACCRLLLPPATPAKTSP